MNSISDRRTARARLASIFLLWSIAIISVGAVSYRVYELINGSAASMMP